MARTLLPLALLLILSVPVAADIGPPPGQKRVPLVTVVEAGDGLPECVLFSSRSRTFYGPPRDFKEKGEMRWRTETSYSTATVSREKPYRFTGGRRNGGVLYAVPKAAYEKNRDLKLLAKEVDAGKVPGSAKLGLGTQAEVPAADGRKEVVRRYRLGAEGSGLSFTRLDDEGQPTGENGSSASPDPGTESKKDGLPVSVRWVVMGTALSLAAFSAGAWLVRRKRG